jgi:hypothetical protein
MLHLRHAALPMLLLLACPALPAGAQRKLDPPKYEPRPIRSAEWQTSKFVSSVEEWTCSEGSKDTRFRFSITTKRPPEARIYVNDKELDAKVVNDLLYSESRAGDIIRIDLTRCPLPFTRSNATFAVHYGTVPADPSYPLGYFSISPDGFITLLTREPWPLKQPPG